MIAFVEGETSNMPAAISLAIGDPRDTGATHMRLEQPRSAALAIPPGAERLSAAQAENTSYPLPQIGRRQNIISQMPLAAPPSIQQLGQAQVLDNAGLPGFQDVTPHLVHEEEWRERFTEYRVWTIRPYPSIDQTQPPSGSWDRCVISEEFLSGAEIKRRLDVLDKDSMTVLEKTTTLAASQQIQITQSMEAAKAGTADHNDQWKLRQLEIIRAKRFFRPKHVKAIVVYVCRVPLLQAFDHHKNPQQQRLETDNDPSSFHFNAVDEDKYTALSGPPVRRHLASKQTIERKERAQSTDSSTSSDETVSAVYSVASTARNRDRLEDNFEWVRRKSKAVNSKRHEIERANDTIASRPSVPRRRSMSPARRTSTYIRTRTSSPNPTDRYPLSSPRSRSSMNRGSWPPIIINNRIYNSPDSSDESDSSEQGGYKVRHTDRHRNVTARRDENDRRRSYERVIKGEAPSRLYSPKGRYYERSPISVERQRNLESEEREREYKVREKTPLDYYVVEDTGGHRRRQSSLSHYSHSVAPRQRSRSVATYRSGPRLLEYYDEERRREKMENRYPAEFDRQPYDPQLSSQEEDARQEAVEQLLLEWTSCYEATNASDDEDAADAADVPPCEESGADTVVDDTITTEPTAQESSVTLRDGQSHRAVPIETEEPGTLQYELREVDAVPPPSATRVDAEFAKAAAKQDQGTTANHNPSLRVRTGWPSRTAMSQQPLPRLPRRETTDGNGVREAADRQPLDASRPQTGTWDDNDDIEIRMLRKGDNIPRVATLPTPARQTWTDANWARQIVEETATVADPDEFESPLRRVGTARTLERELSPRERERERARRRRDIDRLGRSALRGQIQDETRVGDRNEGSFEQRLGPPPRRRTVEFEAALSERHSTPRERERERSRGAETYIERDYYVSRPREEQGSRLRGRDRDRDNETYIRRDYYG
ncbi:hypothetical protein HD806DRAFT_524503 [Xylariaceae sp. AK1471]|nr:hypothetical protein HD806DRAFT_524503 [Xylariaceae sp. AK1471]